MGWGASSNLLVENICLNQLSHASLRLAMGVQISAGSKFNKIFKAKVSHGDRDLN